MTRKAGDSAWSQALLDWGKKIAANCTTTPMK